ncbi:Uncharacterized membrane protein, DUF485 family [Cupriavidus sp. YR651]|uniref:DUF485 domain-containing protein n=1 Tax=Cupriavidus sp. YR651 TaxID=1855315 RepID=UPI0008870D9D|nr:DUF485 domain-containing protein [Cupriavidus sp. YR651]SDC71110.1 Uncharacterized membrane protein, DUF485 family [Cupriavidus sp. YR651]
MHEDLVGRLKASPRYQELVRRRTKLGWALTTVMLVIYFGYILLIAFDKEVLAAKIGDGVMTWGMPIGLFVIAFTVAITGFYVRHANRVYDDLTDQIKREVA